MHTARLFIQRAMTGAEELPASVRADLYDIAAECLARAELTQEAEAATKAAANLREAEASQLLFKHLLTQAAA